MKNNNNEYSLKDLLNHPEFIEGTHWSKKSYHPEDLVIVEGEKGNEIFVILNGKLSVCTDVELSENRKILSGLCELFDGEEFAHSCFFDDEPHCATIKAISFCDLAVIDASQLREFLSTHSDIGFNLLYHWIKIMLPRIRQGNQRFSNLFSWGLKAYHLDSSI